MLYFQYTEDEVTALMKKDKALALVIQKTGRIERPIIPDIYQALVNAIIGQQISTKAHQTIWKRMVDSYGDFKPEEIHQVSLEEIQKIGISNRKATYIKELTKTIIVGDLDVPSLTLKSDKEVCDELVKLKGIGTWTAEMIMLHAMQRKDILSYDDLAIQRGMRMLYRHRQINRKLFDKYRRRYSPYGSIASLYLWRLSANIGEDISDPGNRKKSK